jgi:hypothetical protein
MPSFLIVGEFTTVIVPMKAQRWTSQMSIGRDSGLTAARRGRGTSIDDRKCVRRLRDRLRCRSGTEGLNGAGLVRFDVEDRRQLRYMK